MSKDISIRVKAAQAEFIRSKAQQLGISRADFAGLVFNAGMEVLGRMKQQQEAEDAATRVVEAESRREEAEGDKLEI